MCIQTLLDTNEIRKNSANSMKIDVLYRASGDVAIEKEVDQIRTAARQWQGKATTDRIP